VAYLARNVRVYQADDNVLAGGVVCLDDGSLRSGLNGPVALRLFSPRPGVCVTSKSFFSSHLQIGLKSLEVANFFGMSRPISSPAGCRRDFKASNFV